MTRACAILVVLLLAGCDAETARSTADEALYVQGKRAFQRLCAGCHEVRTRVHLTGPYLVGVEGRRAGSVKGFDYSVAMRDFGLEWDNDALDAFLADPRTTIPGTKMAIEPLDDPAERAAVIYFITQR